MNRSDIPFSKGVGGYTVIKNSWRGKYKRLMSITSDCIETYNPQTMEVTNSWKYEEVYGFCHNFKNNPQEFILNVPKVKGKGPSQMFFQSPYIREIMTDIYCQYKKFKFFDDSLERHFTGNKYRFDGSLKKVRIICTPCSIDICSINQHFLLKRTLYKDIRSLHHINGLPQGIAIKSVFNSRMSALTVDDPKTFLQIVIDFSHKFLEHNIQLSDRISKDEYDIKRLGDFHEHDFMTILSSYKVEKFSQLEKTWMARIMCITENAIFERDPATYTVVSARSISRIYSFYRSVENLLMFGIEWVDSGQSMSVYQCNERDSLISSYLDVVRLCGNRNAYVHSIPLARNLRYSPLKGFVDEEIEMTCTRLLSNNYETIHTKINTFNINIPCMGFQHAHGPDSLFGQRKDKIIQDAIVSILMIEDFENLSIHKFSNIFMALKRLFSSKAGFDSFVPMKYFEKFGPMMSCGCKKNDQTITYSAIEAYNSLLIPFHPNPDQYSEQKNRLCLLSHSKFIKFLLSLLKNNIIHKTGTLIISALLDMINFTICMPYSVTTYEEEFKMFMEYLIDVGSPLFRLFNDSSPSIVKSIGIIIKTILDECDQEVIEKLQEMALSEGIFPKHLHTSLFTFLAGSNKFNKFLIFNRQMSRQLLGYWVMDNSTIKTLLYRSMPVGLVNSLYSDEEAPDDAIHVEQEREEVKLEVENTREVDVFIRNLVGDTGVFLKHWHARVYESLTGIEIKNDKPSKIVILREAKPPKTMTENWSLFYYKFYHDYSNPDMIWNNKTRGELKEALETTIRGFFMDQDLGPEVKISWNYEDFEIRYQSLKNEIMIGDYYLTPLMEEKSLSLIKPKKLFKQLYHVFLQTRTDAMKVSCLKAMTFVYSKYFNEIGPFPDIAYVCYLLQNVKTSFERDLLILLLRELVLNKENARKFISLRILEDLVDMSILSHLHTSRAPVPLQTLMIEGLTTPQTSTPVWYLNVGGKSSEPLSFQQLKEKYDEREIDENTKVWAQGMEGWKQLKDISQLKWTILHSVGGIFNQTDLAIKILDIVTRTCVFFPNIDHNGSIVIPLPTCSRILTNISCLPHLSQLFLTFDPSIVERVATILNHVMIENPVLPKFFITGCYFFMLMYTGSNISQIAQFLKSTHLKQAFMDDKPKKNKFLENSILSPLLPEAMIAYIESYDSSEFAKAFLGEYDNPELIWSNEMRRFLIQKISVHLADFIPALKNNIKSLYMYCPIPRIEYQELQGELFCRRYYLRHLCDTIKFPHWRIDEPLETLREILDAWQTEVNKKPSQNMTLESAYKILGLEPLEEFDMILVSHEQSVVRRAYLKLVTKYHPDKNPDGQETFHKIVDAYEYVCNYVFLNETPSVSNILLLIKSQSILFVNYKKELEPYKYPAYPLLLETIQMELKNDDIFSINKDELILLYAVRLAHHTISCSSLNAEELRRENGITTLQTVFDRCINLITERSEPNDTNILVIEEVIRCFIASCRFSGFINVIVDIPQIFQNFNHILFHYKNILLLCCTTVECITALCSSDVVHYKLLKYGIVYHLIYHLFVYDYTLSETGSGLHDDSNIQLKLNEFANLCLLSLSIIATNTTLHLPLNADYEKNSIIQLLSKLLSPYMIEKLSGSSIPQLLKLLNTNTENPHIIWNNNTRSQLKKLLNEIRRYDHDTEEMNFERVMKHEYEENLNQLIVGNIYIYIFNKNPTFIIENPKKVTIHFLRFIENHAKFIYSAIKSNHIDQSLPKKIQDVCDVAHALHSLMLQEFYPDLFDKNIILILFSFFSLQQCQSIQVVVLRIINVLVSQAECVLIISNASIIGYLNLALNYLVREWHLIFEILSTLFSHNKIALESINKATYIYLLDIFCQHKDIEIRRLIAELFAKLMGNKSTGPRYHIILQKFWPRLFLDAIMDDIQSMILLYESQQENPELLWNTETRDTVSTYISNLKNKVFEKQQEDPNSTYDISKDFVDNINQEDSLMIANVSVHRFIAQPSWVLRHSREFLCGLFDKIYPTYTTKKLIDISEDMETLTTAICLFLQYNPVQCDQLPSLGHISKMIGFLDKSSTGSSVAKSTLRILNSCSNTRSCILDIYKNERWLFAVLESFEKRPDCAMLGASIINNCFSQEVSLVSTYILQNDFIPKLVRVLNYPLQEIERPLEAKAFIVNGLQALEKDLTHGKRITQLLNDFPEWKQYRFQKHDLFIDQSDTQHLLMQNTAGVAGYLLAAQNTNPVSYSSVSAIKMSYDTEPPLPPEADE